MMGLQQQRPHPFIKLEFAASEATDVGQTQTVDGLFVFHRLCTTDIRGNKVQLCWEPTAILYSTYRA